MQNDSKIIDYLKQLDLSDIEAKLYLTLLNTGPVSVRDLAKTTGIKRTTSYLYIDQLVDKGLAMKLVKSSKKQVAATQPVDIKNLIEKKLETIKSVQKAFPDILNTLNAIQPQSNLGDAEVKYFKGVQSMARIYEEAMKSEELCLYATLSELAHLVPEDLFEKSLKHNPKLKIYEIYGDSPENIKEFSYTANNDRYFYKFMPPEMELTAPGILHYDNKVAIINIKGKQHSATVLNNKDYYSNSKKIFNFIWSILPGPKA